MNRPQINFINVFYAMMALVLYPQVHLFAQKKEKNHIFSIGSRHAGIGFGNPDKYHGLRFGIFQADDFIGKINGIDCSVIDYNERTNGIRLGILATCTKKMNGIEIGGFCSYAEKMNGISAGLTVVSDTINGISAGFLMFGTDASPCGKYHRCITNGIAVGIALNAQKVQGIVVCMGLGADEVNGLYVTGIMNNTKKLNGVGISLVNMDAEIVKGISVAGIINKTKKLHGLQIGLINYAGNNPRLFKWIPLINFHL